MGRRRKEEETHEIINPYVYTYADGSHGWSTVGYDGELYGTTYSPWSSNSHSPWSTSILSNDAWIDFKRQQRENLKKELKKEIGKVDVFVKRSPVKGEHIVACNNENDLSVDNVLTTLSAVKGKLSYETIDMDIHTIECSVTPVVRDNIITASKKLKMYGKQAPIVACFDEYGKRLPDQLEIGVTSGIKLNIIDPKEHGEYYYELKGIESTWATGGTITFDVNSQTFDPDLPF